MTGNIFGNSYGVDIDLTTPDEVAASTAIPTAGLNYTLLDEMRFEAPVYPNQAFFMFWEGAFFFVPDAGGVIIADLITKHKVGSLEFSHSRPYTVRAQNGVLTTVPMPVFNSHSVVEYREYSDLGVTIRPEHAVTDSLISFTINLKLLEKSGGDPKAGNLTSLKFENLGAAAIQFNGT